MTGLSGGLAQLTRTARPPAQPHRLEPLAWAAAVLALFAGVSAAQPRAMWPPAPMSQAPAPGAGLPDGFAAASMAFDDAAEMNRAPREAAADAVRGPTPTSPRADLARAVPRAADLLGPSAAHALADERARPAPPLLPRSAFLMQPPVLAAALSPDGGVVAWLQQEPTGTDLWRIPTVDGAAPVRLLRRIDASALAWSHDGRWLFLVNAQRVVAMAMAGQAGTGVLARLDGAAPRTFVGVDPSHPAAVWLRRDGEGWRRVGPGVDEPLLREVRPVLEVVVDAAARPVLARIAAVDHQLIVRLADGAELVRCPLATRCSLLPRSGALGAWMLSDLGVDRQDLRRLALHGPPQLSGPRTTLTAAPAPRGAAPGEPPIEPPVEPLVELGGLVLAPHDGRPLLGRLGAELIALDPAVTAPLAELRRQLPGGELSVEPGAARWLVRQRFSTGRGERYHLFEPRRGLVRPLALGPRWPAPDEAMLAPKLPVRWQASDGRWLFGYLSVPPGRDLATVPLLVKPHGGPWSATDASYDAVTQLLANRGCAVFEPNFRGSTGMGRDYLLAAGSDFGNGRVQRDIIEGTRAMLAAGVGDPDRVAAFGASFGGYSALLAVTHTPELFRAAIAAAPPTDFGRALADAARGAEPWHDSGVSLAATLAALGLDPWDPAQRARLHREGPAGSAAQLARPVLLMAGGRDDRVSARSVLHYAATLAALGKDVSLYFDAEAGHTLEDPLRREAMLYLAEHMLHRLVATPPPAPPSAPLAELLRARIKLVGPALSARGSRPPPPPRRAPASATAPPGSTRR